uniref:Endonuclease n=1 Tax=Photinus pyralis TaxID=7054 RepID=A0A1Y1LS02_PHOPY
MPNQSANGERPEQITGHYGQNDAVSSPSSSRFSEDGSHTPPGYPNYHQIASSERRLRDDMRDAISKICQIYGEQKKATEALTNVVTSLAESVKTLHHIRSETNGVPLLNSTFREYPIQSNSEVSLTNQNQTGVLGELSQTCKDLRRTLDSNSNSRFSIKRNYKLTQKVPLNVWYDYLNSELSAYDVLNVINENPSQTKFYSSEELQRRKHVVRDIIINHVDEHYHKRILNIREPIEILKKLKEIRKAEANLNASSVRAKLYNIKMSTKESINSFYDRFMAIIQEYETCESEIPLSEEEKRSAFYRAVSDVNKTLSTVNFTKRQSSDVDMTIDEIKTYILQMESEKNNSEEKKPKVQLAQGKNDDGYGEQKCFRCKKWGHKSGSCPLTQYNLWYCFYCQKVTDHKGTSDECPCKGNPKDGYVKSDNNKSNSHPNVHSTKKEFRGYNKSRGKGTFRGNGRVYKRTTKPETPGRAKRLQDKAKAYNAGNNLLTNSSDVNLTFIADSGATDHIINKSMYLHNFKKSSGETIRSANKNKCANITIDGRGNLFLKSNINKNEIIKLSNVIAASNISVNLISLRRFVDLGLGIILDNEKLIVFDKNSGSEYLKGNYDKPNWIISLKVDDQGKNSDKQHENQIYSCKALIGTLDELLEQSQSDIMDINQSNESENLENPAEIGREKSHDLVQDESHTVSDDLSSDFTKFKTLNENIIDLNKQHPSEVLNVLKKVKQINSVNNTKAQISEGMLWHIKLGHASVEYLKKLQKSETKLRNIKFDESILDCEACVMAKMQNQSYSEVRIRANRPLARIHTDVMGPIKPESHPGGNNYVIVFVDDYSRYAKTYCMKHKSEAGACLEKFLIYSRNFLGRNEKVCYIRADNAKEYVGGKFSEIMKSENIENDFAPPYTPEHNGTAERFNKTLQWKIRALMSDSGLPKRMWMFATEVGTHLYNRTPHKTLDYDTPLHKFSPNAKSHLDKIRRFGCLAYAKIPIPETKFSDRAVRGVMVGYTKSGYVLWHPDSRKFITSRNLKFNEKLVYRDVYISVSNSVNSQNKSEQIVDINDYDWMENSDKNEKPSEVANPKKDTSKKRKSEENKVSKMPKRVRKNPERTAKTNRPIWSHLRRAQIEIQSKITTAETVNSIPDFDETNTNQRFDPFVEDELRHAFVARTNQDPVKYKEAIESDDASEWLNAIRDELQSMEENEVWDIVDRPITKDGKKIHTIDSRWVFKRKAGENGKMVFKARLVIRGFKDVNEYELKETYAPVSRLPVIRAVLAVINKYDLDVFQMDVKTAFLNGVLEESIFMEIPEGLDFDANFRRNKVCKLKRALYGLRVSPKRWNKRLSVELIELGLEKDINEPCLFTWRKNGQVLIVMVYVDDMILAGNNAERMNKVKTKLCSVFQMKVLGEPEYFLGIKISRDRENQTITLTQSDYVEKCLERFNMKDCNTNGNKTG